jgi:hypothetical protein
MVPPTRSQKDGVEGNEGSLKDGAEAFLVLFLRGTQLVLRSSVFAVLDLDEVDIYNHTHSSWLLRLSSSGLAEKFQG